MIRPIHVLFASVRFAATHRAASTSDRLVRLLASAQLSIRAAAALRGAAMSGVMIRRAVIAAGIAAALVGCGRRDLARVSGRIMFKGQPVANALVMFVPPAGPAAGAVTDADGRYALRTGGPYGNWVVTGRCQVSVGESDLYHPKLTLPIPGRLASPAESGLSADLVPGPNVCDFDLPTDGRPAQRWPSSRGASSEAPPSGANQPER